MIFRAKQDDFSKIDKKLSFYFGLLIFAVMSVVFLSTLVYFYLVVQKEQERLGSVIANGIGDSINRVSFSGKYQAGLLIEDLKSKNENIYRIIIQNPLGAVVADSSQDKNSVLLKEQYFDSAKQVLVTGKYIVQDVQVEENGKSIGLIEIDVPYKKGYGSEVAGVTRIFLSADALKSSFVNGMLYLSILVAVLVLASYFVVKTVSARIGAPIKNLAFGLQGILKYTPLSISIVNIKNEVTASSPLFDELGDYLDGVDVEKKTRDFVFDTGEMAVYDYTLVAGEQTRYFHATKYPIALDEHGKVYLVCTIAIDITERKHDEEQLFALNKNLEKMVDEETGKRLEAEKVALGQSKMAMMGEMIGAIAHQWRQPLNSLAITIQDVYFAYKTEELDEKYITEFKQEAMRIVKSMSRTIDDFRNFFSPDKVKAEFCVENAMEETLVIISAQLTNHDIVVHIDGKEEHSVFGYKGEFQQVILNLVSNAKDAIDANANDERCINIKVSDDDEYVIVDFEDSGGGIDSEVIDRIFEPYFSTKEQGKGVGIGLYMSKQIIERHMGGKLDVQNGEKGARFIIRIPTSGRSIA